MLISYKWLKQFVDLPDSLTPEELGLRLTMSTVEVDGILKQGKGLEDVIVGEILEIKKHPNADKLSVAKVDVGAGAPRQVIFGQMAKIEVGNKVPMALAPTVLPGNKEIKKTEVRGVLSEGMLCLDQELGILKEGVSIHYFGKEVKIGSPITKVLGLDDVIFEIDNKSVTNRPDLWGHYGIAREVAALFRKELKEYSIKNTKKQDTNKLQITNYKLQIDIKDKENCLRYIGAMMGGIKIAPSPKWMQEKLTACGVRPINNIVDITNYVTLELGRPSHAFDRRDMKNDTIIVRRAKQGEKFTTLDGQEREMTDQMCMVCDAERAVDLGGIMGGLNSEIKEDTTEIILELANFNPANIRRTANALGLRTEAAVRFEKGLPPYLAEVGMWRIINLIKELIPGAFLMSKIVDVNYQKEHLRKIELPMEFLDKKVGIKMEKKTVIDILQRLGFVVKAKKNVLSVIIPLWRPAKDISIPEDLVEEVARIYGYDNIKTELPMFSITPPEQNQLRLLERKMKDLLALEHGFTEVYNYSFVSPQLLDKLSIDYTDLIELDNPVAKDRPYLRVSLLPNLLENTEKNAHFADSVRLFEIGKIFEKNKPGMRVKANSDDLLPRQKTVLGVIYMAKGDNAPFYEMSAAIRGVLDKFGVKYELVEYKGEKMDKFIHPGRYAVVKIGDDIIGMISELHPSVQPALGIDNRVAMAEIGLDNLLMYVSDASNYEKISQYPSIVRDIAFVIDKKVQHADIVSALQAIDPLIRSIELFDVFEGANIGEGKKSLAYHITYQSDNKTLESSEVDKAHGKVFEVIEDKLGGEIRK